MKVTLLITCCILMAAIECFAQNNQQLHPTRIWPLSKDSIEIDYLSRKHITLVPIGLRAQIGYFDDINREIFKDTTLYSKSFLQKNKKSQEKSKNEFLDLADKIDAANSSLTDLKNTHDALKMAWQENPNPDKKFIKTQENILKSKKNAYRKALNQVRWKENRIAFTTYVNLHDRSVRRYPLVTVMLGKYQDSKEQNNKTVDSLKKQINNLEDSLYHKQKEGDDLLLRINDIRIDIRLKKDSLDFFSSEDKKAKNNITNLKIEVDRITNELKKIKSNLEESRKQFDIELEKRKSSNDSLSDLILPLQDTLTTLQEKIKSLKTEYDSSVRNIDKEKEYNESLVIFLVFSVLGSAILAYALFRWRKEGKKLQRAHKKLTKTNLALAEANLLLAENSERQKLLVREMHHRTRNNLQRIRSYIYMQSIDLTEGPSRSVLNEAIRRVDILGLLHEQLYMNPTKDLTSVNLAKYLEGIVKFLIEANGFDETKIKLTLALQEVIIEMDSATQIGLSINELIQNCFKHAYKETNHPALRILMYVEENNLNISISDNGPGFPEMVNWETTSSFGLRSVRRLIESENGEIRYEKSPEEGSTFYLKLPKPKSNFDAKKLI